MKKTHKDLLEWLGLKVGDVIRFNDSPNKWIVANEEYITLDPKVDRYIDGVFKRVDQLPITHLIEMEFNILPKPERVGDLKCGEISENKECSKCPLRSICATLSTGRKTTLYEMLEIYKLDKGSYLDQEIYDLLKARLDREVKENDDKM